MSDPSPPNGAEDNEAPDVEGAPGRPDSTTERVQVLPGPPPRRPSLRRPFPWGWAAVGLLLVAGGVLWLIQSATDIQIPWRVALPAALIAVGLALVAGARSGRHSWLIAIGVVLTVSLIAVSSFDIKLEGGVGDRIEHPRTLAELQRAYHLSVGQLTIDLRDLELATSPFTRIEATVGLGQLVVRVPAQLGIAVDGRIGAGDFQVFGDSVASGLDIRKLVNRNVGRESTSLHVQLALDLSVGLGQIQVTG
jgi:hypothetical protein